MLNSQYIEVDNILVNINQIRTIQKNGEFYMIVLNYSNGHPVGVSTNCTSITEVRLWLEEQSKKIVSSAIKMSASMVSGVKDSFDNILDDLEDKF